MRRGIFTQDYSYRQKEQPWRRQQPLDATYQPRSQARSPWFKAGGSPQGRDLDGYHNQYYQPRQASRFNYSQRHSPQKYRSVDLNSQRPRVKQVRSNANLNGLYEGKPNYMSQRHLPYQYSIPKFSNSPSRSNQCFYNQEARCHSPATRARQQQSPKRGVILSSDRRDELEAEKEQRKYKAELRRMAEAEEQFRQLKRGHNKPTPSTNSYKYSPPHQHQLHQPMQVFPKSPPKGGSPAKNLSPHKYILTEDWLQTKKKEQPARKFKLQDFVRGKLVGSGKFGNVYLVREKDTGCLFALKTIKKEIIKQYRLEEQLARQIRHHCFLRHPNIIDLYAFFDDKHFIYLVEEFAEGGQLYRMLKKQGGFKEAQAVEFLKQVLSGLSHMHRKSIIHRDIKPENLVLKGGVVKICDFGWSVQLKNEDRKTFCGTPEYVSPEIIRGEEYNQGTDIWSIGVLAYQFLYGTSPFKVDKEDQIQNIVKNEPEYPQHPQVTDLALSFIKGLLVKDQKKRPPIAEVLRHPWLSKF